MTAKLKRGITKVKDPGSAFDPFHCYDSGYHRSHTAALKGRT